MNKAHWLDEIDWQRPWLAPLLPAAQLVLNSPDWRHALNDAATSKFLRNHRSLPLHFVPQADLPPDTAYEAFISATGAVPTRDNLHDFFNALVWLTFPLIKARLNALQAAEIEKVSATTNQVRAKSTRGKLRDAATIFDENAALLVVSDLTLADALRHHRWREAFVSRRPAFGTVCEVRLFGHALMEKLVKPYKAITAHAWVVEVDQGFFAMTEQEKRAHIDMQVARQLANGLSTADFTPLPVLGVPVWDDQQDEKFYADTAVFRPKRAS